MTTTELSFLGLVAAILPIGFAWIFAPRDRRSMQLWINQSRRRASAPRSLPARADDDRS